MDCLDGNGKVLAMTFAGSFKSILLTQKNRVVDETQSQSTNRSSSFIELDQAQTSGINTQNSKPILKCK